MRLGSLCTGYGGLDIAVESVLGAETVWLSEIDKDAAKVCEARFPGAPNLGDLTKIDWPSVEPVDVLTAGYPCQPFSHAGKRQGEDDDRHIWPEILESLRVLRPRLAVFENVAGHLSLGFDTVLGDLASIGFDAEWCAVRASDVGACHQRKRLFILAADASHLGHEWSGDSWGRGTRPADHHLPAADADGDDGTEPDLGPVKPRVGAPRRSDAGGLALATDWSGFGPAIKRHERLIGRPAPTPGSGKQLNAHFVEWMMCLPEGWVTDILPRRPALKALGNGVVPPQAAFAIDGLLRRRMSTVSASADQGTR